MVKVIILVVVSMIFCSCTYNKKQIETTLNRAEILMQENPDSSLVLLRELAGVKIASRPLMARYSMLHSQALDKNYIDLTTDSIITPAVDYYSKKGSFKERATTFFYLGRIYSNGGEEDKAIESFLKAKEFTEQTGGEGDNLKGLVNGDLGRLYSTQHKFDQALEYFDMAIKSYKKSGNQRNLMYAYENKTKTEYLIGKYEQAFISNAEATIIGEALKDTLELLSISNDKAAIYMSCNKPDLALLTLHDGYLKYNAGKENILDFSLLSSIYLGLNNTEKARFYAEEFLKYYGFISKNRLGAYLTLSDIEKQAQNYIKAIEYQEMAFKLSDSIDTERRQYDITVLEKMFRSNALQEQIHVLEKRRFILFVVSGLFVLFCIAVVYSLFLRWRLRFIKDSSASKTKNQILHTSIDNQIVVLNKILEITAASHKDCRSCITQYVMRNQDNTSELLDSFRSVIDSQAPGIVLYMFEKYPSLSSDDMDLYCMSCLDLSNTAICLIFNSSQSYLYNRRSLLRKHLEIENPNLSLKEHLQSCIQEFLSKQRCYSE